MANGVTRPLSSRNLLTTLLGNPDLPAFVQGLPAPVLKRLIDHVGLEDAGALLAVTRPDQFRDLFEASIWQSLTPGQADAPKPVEFLRWLAVMLDQGAAFAVERLHALGTEFVAAQFAPAVRVLDKGATVFMVRSDDWLEFDDHMVSIVDPEVDGALEDLLREIYAEDAELLASILAACCFAPTPRGFADTDEQRQADEAHARRSRREQQGYVAPDAARGFLHNAQRTSVSALSAQEDYDALSCAHLRRASGTDDAPSTDVHDTEIEERVERRPDRRNLRALESALVDARVLDSGPPVALLTGPRSTPNETILPIQRAIDELQYRDPAAFSARLAELAYLANILMTGSWNRGERFEEADAARVALACANLGLDHLEHQMQRDMRPAVLAGPPGLVRPFQIGWHLIQQLPRHAGERLVSVLRDDDVQDRLTRRQWLLDEVLLAINEPDMLDSIVGGDFEDVADNLRLVSLVVDRRVCHCLEMLIADLPRFPLQLNVGLRPGGREVRASRHIETMLDLRKIHAMLRELEAHVRA
jgi:hypothetical protein